MTILPNTPTSAEVIAGLEPDGMELTVLAEVARGPFKAAIKRHDAKDGTEAYSDAPQIEIDCSDQDGGELFCDLTILPQHVDDFLHVAIEIWADFRVITDGIETESQDGAFEGAWHRSQGTVGTPSMCVGPEKKEVYASTFWQANDHGQITQPYLSMNCGADVAFLPSEAMTFAAQLLQEATRAVAMKNRSDVAA